MRRNAARLRTAGMQRFDSDAIRSLSVRLGLAMLLVLVLREPAAAGDQSLDEPRTGWGRRDHRRRPARSEPRLYRQSGFGPAVRSPSPATADLHWTSASEGIDGRGTVLRRFSPRFVIDPSESRRALCRGESDAHLQDRGRVAAPGRVRRLRPGASRLHPRSRCSRWIPLEGTRSMPTGRSMSGVATTEQAAGLTVNNGLPPEPRFWALAVRPAVRGTVFAGGNDGVFKSLDSGGRWFKSDNGLDGRTVVSLAIDPRTSSIVFAATADGVFRSVDGGASWQPTALAGIVADSVADRSEDSVGRLRRNRDWSVQVDGLGLPLVAARHGRRLGYTWLDRRGTDSRTVYAYPYSGLIRSADGGTSGPTSVEAFHE